MSLETIGATFDFMISPLPNRSMNVKPMIKEPSMPQLCPKTSCTVFPIDV